MNKIYVLFIMLLFVALLGESVVTTMPFVTIVIVVFACVLRQRVSLLAISACIAGLVLDTYAFRPLGVSSLFFLLLIYLVLKYQERLATENIIFILLSTLVGVFFYLILFGYPYILLQLLATSILIFAGYYVVKVKSGITSYGLVKRHEK